MLTDKNRLKKKRDFDYVFKNGKGLREGFLSLKLVKNGTESTRFGFIVGQKVSKKATERNKIKRGLREAVKKNLNRTNIGLDIILMAGKGIKKEGLDKTVQLLFKKARITND